MSQAFWNGGSSADSPARCASKTKRARNHRTTSSCCMHPCRLATPCSHSGSPPIGILVAFANTYCSDSNGHAARISGAALSTRCRASFFTLTSWLAIFGRSKLEHAIRNERVGIKSNTLLNASSHNYLCVDRKIRKRKTVPQPDALLS